MKWGGFRAFTAWAAPSKNKNNLTSPQFLAASASITMPAARKRFFISYSRADKDLVEPIVQLLRTAPTDVFFDIDSIEPGDIWTDRLERAIKGASSFVIFWCDHSANSAWVRKEWTFAVGNKKRIIPVFLDSTGLPDELKTFQGINFRRFAHGLHLSPPVMMESASAPKKVAGGAKKAFSRRRWIAPLAVGVIAAAAVIAELIPLNVGSAPQNAGPSFLSPVAAAVIIAVIIFVGAALCWLMKPRAMEIREMKLRRDQVSAPRIDDVDVACMAQLLRERLQEEPPIPDES
jgi:hypothetical protein